MLRRHRFLPSVNARSWLIYLFLGFIAVFGLVHKWQRDNSLNADPIDETMSSDSLEYLQRYNLLEEQLSTKVVADLSQCNLDYMNKNKLAQNHPCVIEMIRRHYLHDPSPPGVPYDLDHPKANIGIGQSTSHQVSILAPYILGILKNQTGGFFVECGAADGEFISNTLLMERSFAWTGLLIEANPHNYKKLVKRNRKSWTLPICLSLEPYPTQVTFEAVAEGPEAAQTRILEVDPSTGKEVRDQWDQPDAQTVRVQCFPLYSVLLAANRTRLDYFSLDIEGHELKVLMTIPWRKVDIRTLTVEWLRIPGEMGESRLNRFMEKNGYLKIISMLDIRHTFDSVFIQDTLNNPQ